MFFLTPIPRCSHSFVEVARLAEVMTARNMIGTANVVLLLLLLVPREVEVLAELVFVVRGTDIDDEKWCC